jgi:hypothetical protein
MVRLRVTRDRQRLPFRDAQKAVSRLLPLVRRHMIRNGAGNPATKSWLSSPKGAAIAGYALDAGRLGLLSGLLRAHTTQSTG